MTTFDTEDAHDVEVALSEAAETLGRAYPDEPIPDGEVTVEDLARALSDSTRAEFRTDVARVLAMLAEAFPAEVRDVEGALAERLDDADDPALPEVLRALGHVSKSHPEAVRGSVGRLVALLDAEDPAVVRDALWVLSNVASEHPESVEDAVPQLVGLLSHEDGEVRRRAARTVGSTPDALPVDDDSALERLLAMLESSDLHRTAGRALVATAPAYGTRLVDELFERLDGGRQVVREHVAWMLVPLAEAHPDLVRPRWPALVELVREDDDHQVRNSAAATLAALATDRPEPDLLAGLTGILDHDDVFVRRYGCLALGDVAVTTGDDTVLRALDAARDDEAALVADLAAGLLADAASEHPEAVAAVDPALVDTDSDSAADGGP